MFNFVHWRWVDTGEATLSQVSHRGRPQEMLQRLFESKLRYYNHFYTKLIGISFKIFTNKCILCGIWGYRKFHVFHIFTNLQSWSLLPIGLQQAHLDGTAEEAGLECRLPLTTVRMELHLWGCTLASGKVLPSVSMALHSSSLWSHFALQKACYYCWQCHTQPSWPLKTLSSHQRLPDTAVLEPQPPTASQSDVLKSFGQKGLRSRSVCLPLAEGHPVSPALYLCKLLWVAAAIA